MKILILNGPNLNMLGMREKSLYGSFTYSELSEAIERKCLESGASSELFQSNHEGDLIERIHNIDYDAIVINAGALTHYSYSLRDALELFKGIKIEVHISNIFAREEFRSKSVISPVCSGTIAGLGLNGYLLAIEYAVSHLKSLTDREATE
ncbi:type II 3-dehydroquinate dehydratase [Mesotoga prima]|uniref:type II 3-dehydroquinate dehydratase n=1 Tax=Mesotoga prima TaxID=1184387 RepID=UPI002B783DB1|nr:type II 3-dehydroquinate dehydratase [Mesotoga prima]HPJ32952.1 type II 3-dehydroquinate dehydratase [Mesotoga prima]